MELSSHVEDWVEGEYRAMTGVGVEGVTQRGEIEKVSSLKQCGHDTTKITLPV